MIGLLRWATWAAVIGASIVAARRVTARRPSDEPELRALVVSTLVLAQLLGAVLWCGFVLRTLHPVALASTGFAAAALLARRAARLPAPVAPVHRPVDEPAPGRGPRAFAVAVAALAAGAVALALVLPPRGFDTLWYHLPSVAHWITEDRITTASFSPIVGRYPSDVEALWTHLAVFARSTRPLVLVDLLLTVHLAIATRALGRLVGLDRSGALVAATTVAATPVVLAQTVTGHVDAAVCGFVVTVAAFALAACRAAGARDRAGVALHLVLLGTAAGLAAGSKASATIPTVGLLVVVLVQLARSCGGRVLVRPALAAVGALAALGAPWYARNLLVDGNPVAPFSVELAGRTVFAGEADPQAWLTDAPAGYAGRARPVQFVRTVLDDARLLVRPQSVEEEERGGGFGPWWPWAGVPAMAVVVAHAIARRRRPSASVTTAVAYLVVAAFAQPYWWWSRFLLPLVVPAALALPAAASVLRRRGLGAVARVCSVACAATVLGGATLGVVHVGYPEEQWAGQLPAVLRLLREHDGDVRYGDVMANRAALEGRRGTVGIDDAAERDGRIYPVLLGPFAGIDLERRLVGVAEPVDAASLRAWIDAHAPVAFAAVPDGRLAALLRAAPDFDEQPGPILGVVLFVRRER